MYDYESDEDSDEDINEDMEEMYDYESDQDSDEDSNEDSYEDYILTPREQKIIDDYEKILLEEEEEVDMRRCIREGYKTFREEISV